MQFVLGWRRLAVVLTTLALALVGIASVGAQDSDTRRFFGFSGDVTIDGQPLAQGVLVVALVDDDEIGRTTVNQAGAWILDLRSGDFTNSPCNLSFVFDGHVTTPGWDTCELRVRLAVTTPGGPQTEQTQQTEDSSAASDVEAEVEATDTEDGELTTEDEGTQPASAEQQQIVRPAPPRTGTGGLLAAEQSTNWPRAAAITALLMLGAALAALVISRRSDTTT